MGVLTCTSARFRLTRLEGRLVVLRWCVHLAYLRPVATLDRQVRDGVLLAGLDIGEAELNYGSERPLESGKA